MVRPRLGSRPETISNALSLARATAADQYTKVASGSFTSQFQDWTCTLRILGGLNHANNVGVDVVVSINNGTSGAPSASIRTRNIAETIANPFRDGDVVVVFTSVAAFAVSWELHVRYPTNNLDLVVQPIIERYNNPTGATWYENQTVGLSLPAGTQVTSTGEKWRENSSGVLVPITDSTYDLGLTGTRIRNVYSDQLLAVTPVTAIAVNNTSDVTVASKVIEGLAAGDAIEVDAWLLLMNNSGAARVYGVQLDIGTTFQLIMSTTSISPISSKQPIHIEGVISLISASQAFLAARMELPSLATSSSTDFTADATRVDGMGWAETASNLTGSQTVALKVKSNNATATQTVDLLMMRVERVRP